ncbi:aminotransferase class V-fold PLP-dependent enzyme [Pseudoxanthomonas wuyuanensis]
MRNCTTASESADPARRRLLRATAALPLVAAAGGVRAGAGTQIDALVPADAWARVAALYDVARSPVPLENGYWGLMARPVEQAYLGYLAQVNREGASFARGEYPARYRAAQARAAEALGIGSDELALTRNATEALHALIGGYNRLQPGDAVLCADVDYDSMITAMRWLRQRRGVEVVEIALPEPATWQGVIDSYAQAMERHPNLRMLLLTQVSHRNGLLLPVAEIAALARARGIDVIVDAAHGIGQVGLDVAALGADFVGVNFHKWLGAPVGVGGLYIRRGCAGRIDPYMGEPDPQGSVQARVHTGTANFAAFMALPEALDLHARIDMSTRRARLLSLRNRWVDAARATGAYELLGGDEPRLHSAIAAFRLRGRTSLADNQALSMRLHDVYGIQVVHRDGLASGACVRVTPALFNHEDEIDRLVEALREIAATA